MNIGFLLYYRDDDDTHLALIAAGALAEHEDYNVSVASFAPKLHKVHPDWDDKVIKLLPNPREEWIRKQQFIVCTHSLPGVAHIKGKNRPRLIRILQCDALGEFASKSTRPEADCFICPSAIFTELIAQRMKLDNIYHVQWASGLPITKKNNIHSPLRLLLPLYGDNARRSSTNIISIVTKLVQNNPHITVSLMYSRTSTPSARHSVNKLIATNNQIKSLFNQTWDDRLAMFASHDLSVLPYVIDGAGLAAIQSLAMGTPCIAFNTSPICDYINGGVDGLLIPTRHKMDKLGLPVAAPNYPALSKELQNIVLSPNTIIDLMTHISEDDSAQEKFVKRWEEIFELARSKK